MKKSISIVLILSVILAVGSVGSNVYAFNNIFSSTPSKLYDEAAIRELESEKDVITKQDIEVFSIRKNGKDNEIYFIDQKEKLTIIPILDSNYIADNHLGTIIPILTPLKNGYKISADIPSASILEFTVKVDIPNDWNIDFCRDETGQIINGSFGIYDSNGTPVASAGLPTTYDAMGKELDATYDINNSNITLNIENIADIHYPVSTSFDIYAENSMRGVADYFHYVGFNIEYEGSLTLGPRYFNESSVISCSNAWDAVVDLFYPYPPYWTDNLSGMGDQYWCHTTFARSKDNWNLEPWRPDVGYLATVLAQCNPE